MRISAAGLQWMGRVAITLDEGVRVGFPGVTCRFKASLASTIIRGEAFGDANHLTIKTPAFRKTLELAPGPFELTFSALTDQNKLASVEIVRRTESWQGTMRWDEVEADEIAVADPLPNRKLLFVGDSITCGAGADRLPPDFPDGPINSNADAAFGMVLGRRLNAQVHLASYGGRGLLRDWQGLYDSEVHNLRPIFERSMPDEEATFWDHERYQPDAVVFGIGTNDFNVGIPDQNVWCEAYRDFILRVREVHPNALVVITNSPMHGIQPDPGNVARAAALKWYALRTQQILEEAGQSRVAVAEFRPTEGSPGDAHPTAPEHEGMADDLESVLRTHLGW